MSGKTQNIDRIDISKRNQVLECIQVIEKNQDVLKFIVFGSAASNKCNDDSDLDLCVVLKPDADKLSYHYTVAGIGRACGHHFDLLNYARLNDKFKNVIDNQGVVVYELS